MPPITIHAAKTNFSKLIARVLAGEIVVIARGSEPVARLMPLERVKSKRKFGALRGKLSVGAAFFEPLPDDELDGWDK